jgi:cytochrome oxidase Cu insertion factor (SCO1/SenC/PrrC family)
MQLPIRYPFIFDLVHSVELTPEEELRFEEIRRKFDPEHDLRKKCKAIVNQKFLGPFTAFSNKYETLKQTLYNVNTSQNIPHDIHLLNIVEDALRQNISDFSEQINELIKFINILNAQYSILFKKNSHRKLYEAVAHNSGIKGELQKHSDFIEKNRESLISHFNLQGKVSSTSWDSMKKRLDEIRVSVKKYRDNVGSHDGNQHVTVSFEEIEIAIKKYRDFIYSLNAALFFEAYPSSNQISPGIIPEITTKNLLKIIYYKK